MQTLPFKHVICARPTAAGAAVQRGNGSNGAARHTHFASMRSSGGSSTRLLPHRPLIVARGEANGARTSEALAAEVTVEPPCAKQPDDEQPQQQQPAATVVAAAAAAVATAAAASSGANKAPPPAKAIASHPLAALAGSGGGASDPFGADELVEELLRPGEGAGALGRRGEALLVAQVLAAAFVVWPPFRLAGLFDLLATLALVAGVVFCVYGLISLGRSFSPLASPRKNHRLVTGGLYAHVRHPLYGGLLLAALGLAAVTRSEGRLACSALLWLVLERKAVFEEAALAARYGAEWAAYCARTPFRFVPWVC